MTWAVPVLVLTGVVCHPQAQERLRSATASIRALHASSPTARARQDPAPCPQPLKERPVAVHPHQLV